MASKDAQIVGLEFQRTNLQQNVSSKDVQIAALEDQNAELLLEVNSSRVYLSPVGGYKSQVISWMDHANTTIHVLIDSFTEDDIGDAVERAYLRGVDVKVVFDYKQINRYSEYKPLLAAGVPVRLDTNCDDMMHHKVAVIDGLVVLTGSFNWSNAAENHNNENLVVIKGQYLATQFELEFQRIWSLSQQEN